MNGEVMLDKTFEGVVWVLDQCHTGPALGLEPWTAISPFPFPSLPVTFYDVLKQETKKIGIHSIS